MKKNLLKKLMLLLCALVAGGGTSWADSTYTLSWGTGSAANTSYFAATSGTVTNIVSFETAKESSSSNPAHNSSAGELRLYYHSGGNGGSVTLTPAKGVVITGFVMTTSTEPSVKYTVNGGTATSVSASSKTYTVTGIEATSSLKIQNVNTTNTQLRITSIQISYVIKSDATISVNKSGESNAATSFNMKTGESITFVGTSTSGATVSFAVKSSTIEAGQYSFNAETKTLTASATGIIVLTASCNSTSTYNAASSDITVTVQAAVINEPEFSVANQNLNPNETYQADVTTDGNVTYTSTYPLVASVDENGLVTANAVGTTTINIVADAGVTYDSGSCSFTVTVNAPVPQNTKPDEEEMIVFYEGFKNSTGNTNEDNFNDNAGGGSAEYDNSGWTTQGDGSVFGSGASVKLGASTKSVALITPTINVTKDQIYTLSFKAAPWNTETTTMNLTVTGGNISGLSTSAMSTQQWNNYSANITATASSLTIKFAADQNRFFLDEVELTTIATPSTTATIAASGYGTVCSRYPMNISSDKFKAYVVTAVAGNTVTFTEVETETVAGGVPLILFGTPGTYKLESEASTNVPAGNMLLGTLAPTYVEQVVGDKTNFGLSGGSFKKINTGVVPANKAYLPVHLEADIKSFIIVFEQTTGINRVERVSVDEAIFNLAGQRVNKAQNGVFISNGRKFVIK